MGQFIIESFCVPYRIGQNANGGETMLFVRGNILQQRLFQLRKKKWLLSCSYIEQISYILLSKRENLGSHLETLSKSLALHSSRYENLILVGDFNVFVDEFRMSGFCYTFDLKSLMKDATSYKKPRNSSSIDNTLTNNPRSFQNLALSRQIYHIFIE